MASGEGEKGVNWGGVDCKPSQPPVETRKVNARAAQAKQLHLETAATTATATADGVV